MTSYEVIEEDGFTSIRKISDDGKVWVLPADPRNSDYSEYLRYTAWVEAGNDPEDFWTRDLDSPEGLEPSQPKEEEETPQEGES